MVKIFKILYCTTTTIFSGQILKENSLRCKHDFSKELTSDKNPNIYFD